MSISDPITVDQPSSSEARIEELEDQAARERMLVKLRQLWDERRFVLRCAIVGSLAATLVAFLIPKLYDSTAQLMPPDSQSSSNLALLAGLPGSGGLGMMAGDLLGIKGTGALFTGVLRSRTVEDRIIDRFDLKKVYGKSLQVKAREKLAERTALGEDRKSGIITLTVSDRDPRRAAAIANAYVEELDTLMARVTTSSAHRERIFLEERLDAVKRELDAAEKDFSQFASSKGAIDITTQGKAMVEAAATLEGQLIAVQSELQGLKQVYSDNNVRVRSTQARINELRQQLKKLDGKEGNSSEKGGDFSSDAPYPTLRQLPILGVPFADKLRRMKVEEAVFETLTKQFELAKVQEAKEIPSVKVLDAPMVPEHKSFPPRLVIISFGVFCTTLAGVIWVLSAAHWQEIDPEDPGKALAQEVFRTVTARIPWVSRNGDSEEVAETQGKQGDRPHAKGTAAGA